MISEKDISKLISRIVAVVATKQDVKKLEERVDMLDEKFDRQLVLLDGLVGTVHDMRIEYAGVSTQLTRHDTWIGQLADTVQMKLEW